MPKVTLLNKSQNNINGQTITSFLLEGFPKLLIAEVNTHCLLSRNWESSRARPTQKVIEQVLAEPFIFDFTKNQKGMSGGLLEPDQIEEARAASLRLRDQAVTTVKYMAEGCQVHKQDANRYLEPWMRVSGVVTATHWENFYQLRDSPLAQPALCEVASKMKRLDATAHSNVLLPGQWHLPYPDLSISQNIAKVASVSYARHRDERDEDAAKSLTMRLADSKHFSPFQSVAMAAITGDIISGTHQYYDHFHPELATSNFSPRYPVLTTGNYSGFIQARKMVELGIDYSMAVIS